ncbi:hypothetical protein A3D66_02630, partial [Candidatus Kaiserbacteria bacterium RIFCSPHIGHO2_02_FULL_50_9]
VSDLQSIQWQVVSYWQQKERLPATLEELQDPISGFVIPRDPKSGTSYEYRATGLLSFELCATFAKEGQGMNYYVPRIAVPAVSIEGGKAMPEQDSWQHKEGRECFERTIDPDRYPPFKNQ